MQDDIIAVSSSEKKKKKKNKQQCNIPLNPHESNFLKLYVQKKKKKKKPAAGLVERWSLGGWGQGVNQILCSMCSTLVQYKPYHLSGTDWHLKICMGVHVLLKGNEALLQHMKSG